MAIQRELVSFDKVTGLLCYMVFDDADPKRFRLVHEQDVQGFLEKNKALQNETDYKKQGIKSGWHHVAHIPDIVQIKWLQEGIDVMKREDWPAVRRKLQDPDYRHLRTTLGNI